MHLQSISSLFRGARAFWGVSRTSGNAAHFGIDFEVIEDTREIGWMYNPRDSPSSLNVEDNY
jgi:hypothetical protein